MDNTDKKVVTVSGIGCIILLAMIALIGGGFVGIFVAVARWIGGF